MINTVRTDVIRQARERDIRMVRFLYCDTSAIIRGKTTHVRGLEDRLRGGIGLTMAMQAMTMLDQLAEVAGLGPVGEVRLVPDPTTFVPLPYIPHTASMCADMLTLAFEPWAYCPRSFLKRMVARAETIGARVYAAFEGEFSLLSDDEGTPRPIDRSLAFSTVGMNAAAPVINDIVSALEAQGLTVEQYYAELAHGQHELSIRHAEGLAAADNQVIYRETVRGVARQHDLLASFAPRPFVDQAGNGNHLHLSLVGKDGRTNLFYDAGSPYKLSARGRNFIGGVLAHLPALVALTCPSVNSYRRLQPQSWSSAYTCWGVDNREAAVRVASPLAIDEAGSMNIELKACDHSSNPYIALGGVIAAGLDGMARELDPGEPILMDPARLSVNERVERGVKRLPASLSEALDALQGDQVLGEALGTELLSAILGVKRHEAKFFAERDVAFELDMHNTRF